MRILIAPNAFKGSLTAHDAAQAIADGLRRALPAADLRLLPIADGGDGTAEVLVRGTGGTFHSAPVLDPLGRPITARFGVLGDGTTGVVELAEASGLRLLRDHERDPLRASTTGTGQVIRAALDHGCTRLIIGVGGSATVDGGAGLAEALGAALRDADGAPIPRGGAGLSRLATIDLSGRDARLVPGVLQIACDVTNPLLGPLGAARVYGPQKGADPAQVEQLESALAHYTAVIQRSTGTAVESLARGGAAGGAAAGLYALCGADLHDGAALVLDRLNFDAAVRGADLLITGEGRLDAQTQHGKAPAAAAQRARAAGVRVIGLAGGVEWAAVRGAFDAAFAIVPGPLALAQAQAQAADLLADTAEAVGRLLRP